VKENFLIAHPIIRVRSFLEPDYNTEYNMALLTFQDKVNKMREDWQFIRGVSLDLPTVSSSPHKGMY